MGTIKKTIEQLIQDKLKLHDVKKKLDALYESKNKLIQQKLAGVEGDILAFLNETGQTSAKTKDGTVFKSLEVRVAINDFNALANWILETGNIDILQKRVSSTVAKTLFDEGVSPTGLKREQYYKLNYRRNKND